MKIAMLAVGLVMIAGQATGQSIIYKCVKDGRTTYTQSPCRPNAYQENRVDINTDMVGTVDPDRETIEAARSRIRQGMTQNGTVTTTTTTTRRRSSTNSKELACSNLQKQIESIESSQRQANSGWWQDQLTRQKRSAQSQQSDLGC